MTTSRDIDARAENLFDDFTLGQLKELAATVSIGKEIGSLSGKNKAQIIAILGRAGDIRKKALTAHKLEAITPYKHLYLYTFTGEVTFEAMATSCRADFPALIDGFSPLPRDSGSLLHLQLCLMDEPKQCIFFISLRIRLTVGKRSRLPRVSENTTTHEEAPPGCCDFLCAIEVSRDRISWVHAEWR